MKRVLVAFVVAAFLGCGGDEVEFDLKHPPQWLKNLDGALPAKKLTRKELAGECLGTQFLQCEARVSASRAMTRKAQFGLQQGEVRITYTPAENANPVTITLRERDKPATVPVRKSGGTLEFRCKSVERCMIDLL